MRPTLIPQYSGAEPNVWTMDYDAAIQEAQERNIPTIVMFTGSWWCPYCQPLERDVLLSQEWEDYLATNQMMLVFLDFPKRGDYTPSATNMCFFWDDDYLTANEITAKEASDRLKANEIRQIEWSITKKTPGVEENVSNYRIGYPTWVILDPSGNRISRMSPNGSRSAADVALTIRRLNQALQADEADELDDYKHWEPTPVSPTSNCSSPLSITASLSEVDAADWYVFEQITGTQITASIAPVPNSGTLLRATVYENDKVLEEKTFSSQDGVVLNPFIQKTGKTYYLCVTHGAEANITYRHEYTLQASWVVPPVEVSFVNSSLSVKKSAGYVDLRVKINRNGNTNDVVVSYQTELGADEPGIAAPDEDYVPAEGTLTWVNGDSAIKTIRIDLINDNTWEGNETFTVILESVDGCEAAILSDIATVTILETTPYNPGTFKISSVGGYDGAITQQTPVIHVEGQEFTVEISRSNYSAGNVTATLTLSGAAVTRFSTQSESVSWSNGELGEKFVTFTVPATESIEPDIAFTAKLTASASSARLASASFKGILRDKAVTQTLADYIKSGASPISWKNSGSRWFYHDGETTGLSTDTLSPGTKPAELSATLSYGILTFKAAGNGTLTVVNGKAAEDFELTATPQDVNLLFTASRTTVKLIYTPGEEAGSGFVSDVIWMPLSAPALVTPETKSQLAATTNDSVTVTWSGIDRSTIPEPFQAAYEFVETIGKTSATYSMETPQEFQWDYTVGFTPEVPQTVKGAIQLSVTLGDQTLLLKSKTFEWGFIPSTHPAFNIDIADYEDALWFDTEAPLIPSGSLPVVLRKAVETAIGPFPLSAQFDNVKANLVSGSGKLPAGMKLSAEADGLWLRGMPTTPETGSCLIQVQGTVPGSRTALKGETLALSYTVNDLPAWCYGTFTGRVNESDETFTSDFLAGSALFTVSTSGKITAKIIIAGKTYSLTQTGFTAETETGEFIFPATFKINGENVSLQGVLRPQSDEAPVLTGLIDVNPVDDLLRKKRVSTIIAFQVPWGSDIPLSPAFIGNYTFSMYDSAFAFTTGFGYMTATVSKTGAVRFSGVNTDGQSFSGSSYLFTLLTDGQNSNTFLAYAAPSAYKKGSVWGEFFFDPQSDISVNLTGDSRLAYYNLNPKGLMLPEEGMPILGTIIGGLFMKNEDLALLYGDTGLLFNTIPPVIPAADYKQTQQTTNTYGRLETQSVTISVEAVNWIPTNGIPVEIALNTRGVGTGIKAPKADLPVLEEGVYTYETDTSNDGILNTPALSVQVSRSSGSFSGSLTGWYDYASAIDINGNPTASKHVSKKWSFKGIWLQNANLDPGHQGPQGVIPVMVGSIAVPVTRLDDNGKAYTVKEQKPVALYLNAPAP